MLAFFNMKDDNFSQMNPLTLVMLGKSPFTIPVFYPPRRTDGNEVPSSQGLSKRLRHLPHVCSRLLPPFLSSDDKLHPKQEIPFATLLPGCSLPSRKLLNLRIPLFSLHLCSKTPTLLLKYLQLFKMR